MTDTPTNSPPTGTPAARQESAREVVRLIYLDAIGVDSYLSLGQLPGAAPTRRLVLPTPVPAQAQPAGQPGHAALTPHQSNTSPGTATSELLGVATGRPTTTPSEQPAAPEAEGAAEIDRFSLVTLQMAGWLWLEQTAAGDPGEAYWQLASAIGQALAGPKCQLERGRFDWPLHRSTQLDAGADAASAALQAFLQRRLEQKTCKGIVLLGESTQQRLAGCQLSNGPEARVVTASIDDMLRDPGLKRGAWRDLQVVLAKP